MERKVQLGDIITKDLRGRESFTVIACNDDYIRVCRNTNREFPIPEEFDWEGDYEIIPSLSGTISALDNITATVSTPGFGSESFKVKVDKDMLSLNNSILSVDQELFDVFERNLVLASHEFKNRQREKEYQELLQKHMNENLYIPVVDQPEFPFYSHDWFIKNGWTPNPNAVVSSSDSKGQYAYHKGDFRLMVAVTITQFGNPPEHIAYIKDMRYDESEDQTVFKGWINNEEDFFLMERLLGIKLDA